MQSLTSDRLYFSQATSSSFLLDQTIWDDGISPTNVKNCVREMLGDALPAPSPGRMQKGVPDALQVYHILTQLLPFTQRSMFFWRAIGRPFASMLESADYPPEVQCRFLVFVYSRVLGFLGAPAEPHLRSMMTADGSSVELSWVIPNRRQPNPGEANRQIRFAIEPMDPRTGQLLRGSDVLNYYASEEGGLGIVANEFGGLQWSHAVEKYLSAHGRLSTPGAEGGRFFIGFDFAPDGMVTLKPYWLPTGPRRGLPVDKVLVPKPKSSIPDPISTGDTDFTALRPLIQELNPALSMPLELMIEYFQSLDKAAGPRFQILSVDCVEQRSNRLKIYFRMNGMSFSTVKSTFTLGGRLSSPILSSSLLRLEMLWHLLFRTSELNTASTGSLNNGQAHPSHPNNGLLFYFELLPGASAIFPKVYLPASHYCENDLQIARAIETFYSHPEVNVKGPVKGERGKGWVSREVSKAFSHRPLHASTGIHTYVTFGVKPKGYELTSYFSPELWDDSRICMSHF